MNSRERMLAAINKKKPDRLPVTTHHVMPYFLNKYMGGISSDEFFEYFGFDPITWVISYMPDPSKGEFIDPDQKELAFLEGQRIFSDKWRIETETLSSKSSAVKYNFITPQGQLSMVMEGNEQTSWVREYLIKDKKDIDIIANYATAPKCDIEVVNETANKYSSKSIIRGHICTFDIFGQPGCWQDAACLVGTEKLIMESIDDPKWVHELLKILQQRKIEFIYSLRGAKYDILELGGGDASSTVISPKIFDEFVAPYDSKLIEIAHEMGQKIVYHTCGGMMPILENIAGMKPDAMETFTPKSIGGDANLSMAKKRIGDKVCMIGGFDQFHFLTGCSPEDTRKEVRRCFNEAGENGGYIISPSDHFFDADPLLIKAFAQEAANCVY